MSLAEIKDLADIFQAAVTGVGLMLAAGWAFHRYVIEENGYTHIETSAEISFIGEQDGYWLVELQAILQNRGKVPHRIKEFGFDLNCLTLSDTVQVASKWGGQVDFPNPLAKGSFIPKNFRYFVIGPEVT